jgi:ligand-binding sensor protein
MRMSDLMTTQEWAELERTIHERYGLNARAYDADGFTFTGYTTWCNRLCPALKSVPSALSAICSVAQQAMAAQARDSRQSVVEECDIGLLKICVPILVNGEMIGVVGGCGLLLDSGEVDTFFVGKATGFDEERVQELAGGIDVLTSERAREISAFIETRVQEIVRSYHERISGSADE